MFEPHFRHGLFRGEELANATHLRPFHRDECLSPSLRESGLLSAEKFRKLPGLEATSQPILRKLSGGGGGGSSGSPRC